MADNLHARLVKEYLEDACERLDARRKPRPWSSFARAALAAPLAVGATLAFASCGGSSESTKAKENCTNQKDDDGDGKIDCTDTDCASAPGCTGTKYGVPIETI